MIKNYFTILALFFSVTPLTFAWNASGHMLVAQIAYVQLSDDARQQANSLLGKDFLDASMWPDDVRAQGDRRMNTWHYINLPHPGAKKNVVDAILDSQKTLTDPKATLAQRKDALRGLLHWVGDIHQPLHTTGYYKGGHRFIIAGGNNLHRLWDDGVGALPYIKRPADAKSQAWLNDAGQEWLLAYPPTAAQLEEKDPMQWAEDGFVLANTQVFSGIMLYGPLSDSYTQNGQAVVHKQIVLAGVRLAQILNEVLVVRTQ
jgi:hypothetical protein